MSYRNPEYVADKSIEVSNTLIRKRIDDNRNIQKNKESVRSAEALKIQKQYDKETKQIANTSLKISDAKQKFKQDKGGIGGASFTELAMKNIDNVFRLRGKVANEPDRELKAKFAKELEIALNKQNSINQFAGAVKGVGPELVQENVGNRQNTPGGQFYGGYGPEVSNFSNKIYQETQNKLSILSQRLNNATGEFYPAATFSQKDDGTIVASGENLPEFNALEAIMKPTVIIENVAQSLDKAFGDYLDKNGELKREYVDYKNGSDPVTTKVKGEDGVTKTEVTYPISAAAQQSWIDTVNTKSKGITGGIINESTYNNVMALYMNIAGDKYNNKTGKEGSDGIQDELANPSIIKNMDGYEVVKPLNTRNARFQLDSESIERFDEAYVSLGLKSKFGEGYITEEVFEQSEVEEVDEVEPIVEMTADTKVKKEKTLKLFDKAFENNDFEFFVGKKFKGQIVAAIKPNSKGKDVFVTSAGRVIGYPDINEQNEMEEMIENYLSERFKDVGQAQRNAMKRDIVNDVSKLHLDSDKRNVERFKNRGKVGKKDYDSNEVTN